jgi:hypothetical protein
MQTEMQDSRIRENDNGGTRVYDNGISCRFTVYSRQEESSSVHPSTSSGRTGKFPIQYIA